MKVNEIKAKIYGKMALHALKKVGHNLASAQGDAKRFVTLAHKSLSADGKVVYEELEEKMKDFYDALPADLRKKYDEVLSHLEDFKAEVKKIAIEKLNNIEVYEEEEFVA